MSLVAIPAAQAVAELARFDAVIDARSESEYAHDHLPGARNWPTLDDAQRAAVGTLYKQVGSFEARRLGAPMAAANIARHIATHAAGLGRDWRPLVYCWRGGKRSGALAIVLDQIGYRVSLIEGGYKAFRAAMLADLEQRVAQLRLRVVCGTTGSGKTRLLHALARAGEQVLDLEDLACHRSSVLGAVPGVPQPSQKGFDTRIWDVLRAIDPQRPVYVESESRKVGNVAVPLSLIERMRAAPCLVARLPDDERVALLMEDYRNFVDDPVAFCERLDVLTELRGKAVVTRWKTLVQAGSVDTVVRELLQLHYDPGYLQSMRRNFAAFEAAPAWDIEDRSPAAMDRAAAAIVAAAPTIG